MSSADVHVKLAEYDHELARITDQDREYANDLLSDLQERPRRQGPVETVAE